MKWRLLIAIAIIAFISWLALELWNTMAPIPLDEALWEAPCPINVREVDFDLDDQLDLVVGNDELKLWWHLRLKNGQWQVTPMPIPQGWSIGWRTFKNNVLLQAPDESLWLLQYRNGWRRQRLVASSGIDDYYLTDLDGDGNANDLVVRNSRRREVWWFQLSTDADAQLRGSLKGLGGYDSLVVRDGKLCRGEYSVRECRTDYFPDVDGDGKQECIQWHPYVSPSDIQILLSKTAYEQVLRVPLDSILAYGTPPVYVADLDSDGRREAILLGQRNDKLTLLRGWLSSSGWQWQVIPIQLAGEFASLWLMQLKQKDCIFITESCAGDKGDYWLTGIWHTPAGWIRRRWHFRGEPVHLWNDKNGWQLAVYRYAWARDYYLWKVARRAVLKFREHGIRIPKIPGAVEWMEVWRWNEERSDWHHTGSFRIGGYTDRVTACDLNGDGYAELIVEETHSNTFLTIGVRVGRLRKRWRPVHLWLNDPYNWTVLRIRDGKRTWIVRIRGGGREVRASTLR